VQRAFHALEQLADVLQRNSRAQFAQIARFDLERLARPRPLIGRPPAPQGIVHHLPQWLSGAARKEPQLRADVVIESQSGPHILMLLNEHQYVNERRDDSGRAAAAPPDEAPRGRPVLHSPAVSQPLLISEQYREMQRRLHENPNYGVASVQYAPIVAEMIEAVGAEELLDYGAGKGRLGQALKPLIARPLRIHHYDPAIPQWSAPPEPCRFVACIDVLEHIEPGLLDIRKRASWWLPKLTERFELAAFNRMP